MWIKLHSAHDGEEVVVQTQNITCILKNKMKGSEGETVVNFIGDDSSYILVYESVDEIGAMIKE